MFKMEKDGISIFKVIPQMGWFKYARIDKFVLSPATQEEEAPEVIAQTEDALV